MTTAIETKERPILFSREMVRAVRDGRKTQTRRIFKPQPVRGSFLSDEHWEFDGQVYISDEFMQDHLFHNVYGEKGSPYGSVWGDGSADRLWVRECIWTPPDITGRMLREGADTWPDLFYDADMADSDREWCREMKWTKRPSIHMPRGASRFTLQLIDIRIERVRSISDLDAIAEGIEFSQNTGRYMPGNCDYASWSFGVLWNQVNGDGAWERNDWVWALTFKKIDAENNLSNER